MVKAVYSETMPIFSSLALSVIFALDEVWGIESRLFARDCISGLDRKGICLVGMLEFPLPHPILVDRLKREISDVLDIIRRCVAFKPRADISFLCIR